MLSSFWMASVLASLALSAPVFPVPFGINPADLSIVSDYFNLLSQKIQEGKGFSSPPACDLSAAAMPSSSLAPPDSGLLLKHVAIGRGTQNYTCTNSSSQATPAAAGAVATLYNASCVAATLPAILDLLPNLTLQWNLNAADQEALYPASVFLSGHHFFTNATTPYFNLDTTAMQLGQASCSKVSSVPAPADAPLGQGGVGNGSVPWLKLQTHDATGSLEQVYRVNTAGGNPPKTCDGMPAQFEVQYAAEYWFWES
ncbi:MAG: hypothetical protein M1818_006530 [Claussenomyces sp. TS43310]|nr:MAG: hypothetical protein M1818_006530 [Claussenomyces sp. TS43310]